MGCIALFGSALELPFDSHATNFLGLDEIFSNGRHWKSMIRCVLQKKVEDVFHVEDHGQSTRTFGRIVFHIEKRTLKK